MDEEITFDAALEYIHSLFQIGDNEGFAKLPPRSMLTDAVFRNGEISWRNANKVQDIKNGDKNYSKIETIHYLDRQDLEKWIARNNDKMAEDIKSHREAKRRWLENLEKIGKIETQKPEKPVDPRTCETLLVIIAALCEKYGTSPTARGLFSELAAITEKLGVPKSADAISRHMKAAGDLIRTVR